MVATRSSPPLLGARADRLVVLRMVAFHDGELRGLAALWSGVPHEVEGLCRYDVVGGGGVCLQLELGQRWWERLALTG